MLDVTPEEQLLGHRAIRGTYRNKRYDFFSFMPNAIINSGKKISGTRKPSKLNVPGCNKRANELYEY